jgi:hypothetical protein
MSVEVKDNVTVVKGPVDSTSSGTEWLCLHVDGEPLVDQVEQFNGKTITVRWWLSDVPLESVDQAVEQTLMQVMGVLDSRIYHAWSECTGYLWTEEHLKIGGHDILQEIWTEAGLQLYSSSPKQRYVLLEITEHEATN